jgi:4-hydroxy-2-oxoheptanedioate aldolase
VKSTHQAGAASFALGPFVKCPTPEMIEVLGVAGFDFAVVDMEHTPVGPRELYPLVLAAERRGLDLVVRIPVNEEQYFKWCLDLGVAYIQVPWVQNKALAEKAVKLSYFRPSGDRGLCRFVRAADFSGTDGATYISRANERTKLILQIEGVEGVQNAAEIASVPGIDALFIGPYDLSQSMGKPGKIWDPDVQETMKKLIALCQAKGVKVGTFTDTPEGVKTWAAQGAAFIEYASDLNLLLSGVSKLKAELSA